MHYNDFKARFGGSYRSKHLRHPVKELFSRSSTVKRPYRLPKQSKTPTDFIRLDPWEGQYLFMVAARASKGIVEIGRFNGGSALLMSCANPDVPIYSVDIAPKDDAALKSHLDENSIGENIHIIVGDSQNSKYENIGIVDLLFVDGDHSYEGCTKDLHNWFEKVEVGGHILLHDCYNGSPVQDSVLDFAKEFPVSFVNSPYIVREHWFTPAGSMVHLIKTSDAASPN